MSARRGMRAGASLDAGAASASAAVEIAPSTLDAVDRERASVAILGLFGVANAVGAGADGPEFTAGAGAGAYTTGGGTGAEL